MVHLKAIYWVMSLGIIYHHVSQILLRGGVLAVRPIYFGEITPLGFVVLPFQGAKGKDWCIVFDNLPENKFLI